MRLMTVLTGIMICTTAPLAWAGGPVGHYAVDGTSVGSGPYTGTVEVTPTGDTYRVVWKIGSETFIGTGIGNDSFMAVSYASGSTTGLALYSSENGDWSGIWAYGGGTTISTENWTRR
ncbi:hypothetical protein [Acidisoma sp.]|uniref:hypothetical protein n=1 Tax=Acidisoma sp. TaxID=1872115 RepID=UPI003B007D6A